MPRRLLCVLAVALAVAAPAGAAVGPVVAVPGLGVESLDALAQRGAVALLVPDAGPETSRQRAVASLRRGKVVNSLRNELPSGPPLVAVRVSNRVPPGLRSGVVVGIPPDGRQSNSTRYAIVQPGRRGLLTSSSTRLDGLVSITDVAHDRLRVVAASDPAGELRDLDARIRENSQSRPDAVMYVAILIAALAFWRARAAVLAFATVALVNLLIGAIGASRPTLVVGLLMLAALAAVPLEWVVRTSVGLGAVLVATIAAYLLGMAIDGDWVSLSPLGPTQISRFYGLSNTLETLLLVPALAGAALLARRFGPVALVLVALLSLVTISGSRFGADGGGALVLAAGYAVLAAGLVGDGDGRRAAVVLAAVAGLAVGFVVADALIGPSTHVGEALRGGPDEVVRDIWHRLELSWKRATADTSVAIVIGASILALAVLVLRWPRRPLSLAVAAAVFVSLIVNDSPKEVAVGGLVAYLAVARFERDEEEEARRYTFGTPRRS